MVHKVLLIDDDEDVLTSVGDLLRIDGFHVEEAADAGAARARLLHATPDVVICDWNLGSESSESFLLDLAATNPRIGRVLLTGSAPKHLESLIDSDVVHAVLIKPFDRADMLAAIREALASASSR